MLIAANYSGRLIDVVYAKGIFRDASGWSLRAGTPSHAWKLTVRVAPRQGRIDADASTYIMNADLNHWKGTDGKKI